MRLHEAIRCTVWAISGLCVLVIWKSHADTQPDARILKIVQMIKNSPQDAAQYCPQLCGKRASELAPKIVCSFCYEACADKMKTDAPGESGQMLAVCQGKHYMQKPKRVQVVAQTCLDAIGKNVGQHTIKIAQAKTKYDQFKFKCDQLQHAAKLLQSDLSQKLVQASKTPAFIALQSKINQLQKALSVQQGTFKKLLKYALGQEAQQHQNKLEKCEQQIKKVGYEKQKMDVLLDQYNLLKSQLIESQKKPKCAPPSVEKPSLGQYGYEPYPAPIDQEWQWKAKPIDIETGKIEWEPVLVLKLVKLPAKPWQPTYAAPVLKDLQTQWLLDRIQRQPAPLVTQQPELPMEPVAQVMPSIELALEEPEIFVPPTPTIQPQSSWWDRLARKIDWDLYEPFGLGSFE